jgi:hypothetical protein
MLPEHTRTDDEILDGTKLYRNSLTAQVAPQNRPQAVCCFTDT